MSAEREERLPDVLVLPQNRSIGLVKWTGILAGIALLGALSALMFAAGQPGWASLFLVLLAAWIAAYWIHLTESLRLDRDGFEYRVGPRRWRCRWADCREFEVRENARGRGRVVIRFLKPRPVFSLLGAGISSEEALLTSFDLKASRLAGLMNRFRTRALGADTTASVDEASDGIDE